MHPRVTHGAIPAPRGSQAVLFGVPFRSWPWPPGPAGCIQIPPPHPPGCRAACELCWLELRAQQVQHRGAGSRSGTKLVCLQPPAAPGWGSTAVGRCGGRAFCSLLCIFAFGQQLNGRQSRISAAKLSFSVAVSGEPRLLLCPYGWGREKRNKPCRCQGKTTSFCVSHRLNVMQ